MPKDSKQRLLIQIKIMSREGGVYVEEKQVKVVFEEE